MSEPDKTNMADQDLPKRVSKPTPKALQEKLEKQMESRKRVLTRLRSKANEIENLMINDSNAILVQTDHLGDYSKLLNEFTDVNDSVNELLSEEERVADQQYWSEPNLTKYENFLASIEQWIIDARRRAEASTEHVTPQDGATLQQSESDAEKVDPNELVLPTLEDRRGSVRAESVHSKHSKASSHGSSLRRREEANRAALLVRAAALKKKQALELEEAQMEAKKIQLKAKMEELDVETAIAESNAKLQVLDEYDNASQDGDGMNSYIDQYVPPAASNEHRVPGAIPKSTSC